jgi:hypothetical protein
MTSYFQDRLPAAERDALTRYHARNFDFAAVEAGVRLPLADEPCVAIWERWAAEVEAGAAAPFTVLARHLPQLAFPIGAGMSQTQDYLAATRRGIPTRELPGATGLAPPAPESVELRLHATTAGRIPLLICRHRETFVALVQALARHNEPTPVPANLGGLTVAGYNNWERIRELRRHWEATPREDREEATWEAAFHRIQGDRALYQDRFILLSDGPYSGVAAHALGLEEAPWQRASLLLRRDHEGAHYFTRRLLGTMRNNILDELMADYAGMQALPREAGGPGFRAPWFLRFLGLETFPHYRPGARLDIYRGDPPLPAGAFRALHHQIHAAAHHLERFDRHRTDGPPGPHRTAVTLLALASLGFEALAGEGAPERIEGAVEWARRRVYPPS